MKHKIEIQCFADVFTPEKIKNIIGEETFNRLKGKGVIKAFITGHEGKASPNALTDDGKNVVGLNWSAERIKELSKVLRKGTKFFHRHGKDNSHEGRKPVGYVLKSGLRKIGGKLANIVLGFFSNERKTDHDGKDICSIEAEITKDENGNVLSVEKTTGIAIEESSKAVPGFPGARQLAVIQCFSAEEKQNKTKQNKRSIIIMELAEIIAAIRTNGHSPSDVGFSERHLREDKELKPLFDKLDTALKVNAELKKAKEELEAEKLALSKKEENKKAAAKIAEDLIAKSSYTDEQKAALKAKLKLETIEDPTPENIQKEVDKVLEDFSAYTKIISPELPENHSGNQDTTEENNIDNAVEALGL